jgi:hypothetical protein
MVFELTVMAGGGRRWILVEEVVRSAVATYTAYLPSLHAGKVSSKRRNGDFERGGEREGVEIEGRSLREVTKSSRLLFCLRSGARAISMVAAACVGVDHFWLTGARDEGGSGDTLNSEVSQTCMEGALRACEPQFEYSLGINQRSLSSWSNCY